MRRILTLAILIIISKYTLILAQNPISYNDFKVVTEAWQIAYHINNTPSDVPVYIVLTPGVYKIAEPITIDRVGAVYVHGLSMAGTLLTDSTNFVGQDLFIVKRTNKFSLAGLTIRSSKPASSDPKLWKGAGISFESNTSNMPHNVEIQEIEQGSSFKINAAGTFRVQSSRVPNLGYIVNHPNADFVMTQGHSWTVLGNYPKPKSTTGNFLNNYSLSHPDDISYMKDSTCIVWQKQGRVRIYNTNNVTAACAYEYRFDSKSNLGPHIITGLRNEIEANNFPTSAICDANIRIFKAIVKVSGVGNEIIFKCNSPVKSYAHFDDICGDKVAFVDFQSVEGKAFILGNTCKAGIRKMIMNSSGINLGDAQIVLLGNKIAPLAAYPNMQNSNAIPQNLYSDIELSERNSIINMGNMTRLNTGLHPTTGNYLTGDEPFDTYGDEVFSDLFLSNTDSIKNAPLIPIDNSPHALTLPIFALSYNELNPSDPATNHELLWKNILINVRNYGAIPNDNKDDFMPIQTAIDTAILSNGLLYFPEGQYDISQTLEFNTLVGNKPPLYSTTNHYGNRNNTLVNAGRSILIAGANRNNTTINGLNNVLSIFSITNSRMSRMQGLTLKVNQGNIKSIRGVTNSNNPSQAIVAVDNFDACNTTGITPQYGSIYLWNFRDCNFIGGQVGASTQMRKQMYGSVRNSKTGLLESGAFSGKLSVDTCVVPSNGWGGLGESFALINCKFENNNIGFVTAHHQSFCHFISDCEFINDTLGISQYGARGASHIKGETGYTADNAGGNFTILNSTFNSLARDFQTTFQTQTVPDYFNNCSFNAPTAMLYGGDNYPALQNNWLPTYRRNKNTMGFAENCSFTYDHTQDALYKNQPIVNNLQEFENYFKHFTFVAYNMSSIFCLNSDLSKTTFTKCGIAPLPPAPANNTAVLQGVGYGMIAQCKIPGQPNSTFSAYGTKPVTTFYFNFNPNSSNIPANNPAFPIGYGTTPPMGLYFPRYFPKEIVSLDNTTTSIANDYYFWRIGLMAAGGTVARHRDYALPMQRILLYNAGNQTPTAVQDFALSEFLNLIVYPNPVQNTLNVSIESKKEEKGELRITDILGRIFYEEKITIMPDYNTINVDLNSFNASTFFVYLQVENKILSKKAIRIQ